MSRSIAEHDRTQQGSRRYRRWLESVVTTTLLPALLLSNAAPILAQDSVSSVPAAAPEAIVAFDQPTTSSPIALDANKNLIWVVNPDDDKVTVIGNLDGTPNVLKQVNVGDEPQAIALDTDGSPESYHVYVANAADDSISIITVNNSSASTVQTDPTIKRIVTGSEPWNVVVSPDGKRAFVANSGQDTITVLRTDTQAVIGAVNLRGSVCSPNADEHFQPRGLAVTLDNSKLYVTRFLSLTGGATPKQGTDDGHVGVVCQLTINTGSTDINDYTPAKRIELAAQITGFKLPNNANDTKAWPNQMQSIVIRGDQAYLPNIAASPSGPLRFNVDTQAFVNVVDGATSANPTDAGAAKSINMHLGARIPEAGKKKLFFANPWAIAFTNQSGAGNAYAVSAGSDLLVKLNVDAVGKLDFTVGVSTTKYIDLNDPVNGATQGPKAGKNPLGIVIRNNKAYVMNYISRNVSIVDLTNDSVSSVIQTSALPFAGSQDEQLHVGKEIFFSSRGHFNRPITATVSTDERLSSEGWQNCASCHFAGLTDGVVWTFVTGPRKSIPMNATWSPHNADDQRILNYSAIFDEVQDFEINARNVSGPGNLTVQGKPAAPCANPAPGGANTGIQDPDHGMLIGDDGDINKAPCIVNAFAKPNGGRKGVTVTIQQGGGEWQALDAMKEWVRFAIRTPNGMLTENELTTGGSVATGGLKVSDVNNGRRLFFQAGCQKCHGGTKWTISNKDFAAPPAATDIFTEVVTTTVPDQYLNRFLVDINSFNLNVDNSNAIAGTPLIGAVEKAASGLDSLGKDNNGDGKGNGFNIPALLGIWHLPPYYHNGACETLACVLSNQTHRKAGNSNDPINSTTKRNQVIAFLQSLDADTPFPTDLSIRSHDIFFDPPTVFATTAVSVGANIQLFGTKADLTDLLTDIGQNIKIRFEAEGGATVSPSEVSISAADFARDFGQAVVSTTFTSGAVGINRVRVTIDPDGVIPENAETNNTARRSVFIRPAPEDRTPPRITSVAISDDDPFVDTDAVVQTRNVKVKIVAEDPASPSPAPTSGLDQYCIVTYSYDVANRIWIPGSCDFEPLPDPDPANTFIVDAEIQPKAGVEYAFVWVKDVAGNISRRPGFDVVTYVPSTPITLNRNDVTILRLPLQAGQELKITATPDAGDIDLSVFDDFVSANATRIALSAQNGTVPEEVTITGPGRFQVEIRAVVNSRFTLEVETVSVSAASVSGASGLSDNNAEPPTAPVITGPPVTAAAVEDEVETVFLPLVTR